MELTLTALIKAMILHEGRGISSRNSAKVKQIQNAPAPLLLSSTVPKYCTLVGYPNLTGSQFFFHIRTVFIFQVECVHKCMVLFLPNFSLLNPVALFFYEGFYCSTSTSNCNPSGAGRKKTKQNNPSFQRRRLI